MLKFPEPKKIDYKKYIEPVEQIFVIVKTGAKIAILIKK